MEHAYTFTLFVTGQATTSEAAEQNLRNICASHLAGRCNVTVVDVRQHPEVAEAHRILATPTLLKLSPQPPRRLIGDLSDTLAVLSALGLSIR